MSWQRIGLFGGTFNPFHHGHNHCLEMAKMSLQLDQVFLVPASRSPGKQVAEGATPQQRVAMLKRATEHLNFCQIDLQEIDRGGQSYTIETVRNYSRQFPESEIYLILGLDQFELFDQWKEFSEILELVNLTVVFRPNLVLPKQLEDLPSGIQGFVVDFSPQKILLASGREIVFLTQGGLETSAAAIRKKLQAGKTPQQDLSKPVVDFIAENALYSPLHSRLPEMSTFTTECFSWLKANGAIHPRSFDLHKLNAFTDFTIIASGQSTRHTSSLAEKIIQKVKTDHQALPLATEGLREGRWVVIDYGGLVIHLFYDFVRQQYQMEKLWQDAIELTPPPHET